MAENNSKPRGREKRHVYTTMIVAIIFSSVVAPLQADVPAAKQHEVEHLISFVDGSDCLFRRNGKDYEGNEAVEHINQKYNYFRKKIGTTEEFIEYSATKSTMSGKLYTVSCARGETQNAQDWLLDELESYRANGGG